MTNVQDLLLRLNNEVDMISDSNQASLLIEAINAIEEMNEASINDSWKGSVDRMSGAYDDSEIIEAYRESW